MDFKITSKWIFRWCLVFPFLNRECLSLFLIFSCASVLRAREGKRAPDGLISSMDRMPKVSETTLAPLWPFPCYLYSGDLQPYRKSQKIGKPFEPWFGWCPSVNKNYISLTIHLPYIINSKLDDWTGVQVQLIPKMSENLDIGLKTSHKATGEL